MIVVAIVCRYLKPLPVPDCNCQPVRSHGEFLAWSHVSLEGKIVNVRHFEQPKA